MSLDLGDIVAKRYAYEDKQGGKEFYEIRTMLNEPSAQLVGVDGEIIHWAQSLLRPATHDETVMYWYQRAKNAELRLNEVEQKERNRKAYLDALKRTAHY